MATTCVNCGKKKGIFGGAIEAWYDCARCGIICNNCDKGSSVLAMVGFSKKCPKCEGELKPRIQKG
jgi:hypothetical protein